MRFYFPLALSYLFAAAIAPPRFFTMTCLMAILVTCYALRASVFEPRRQIAALTGLAPLLAFLLSYSVVNLAYGQMVPRAIFQNMTPLVVSYLIGYFSAERGLENSERAGVWLLLATVAACALYALICVRITGVVFVKQSGGRVFTDFWGTTYSGTGFIVKSAFGVAVLFAALAESAWMNRRLMWIVRGVIFAAAVASLLSVFRIGNRSGVVVVTAANLAVGLVVLWHVFRNGWAKRQVSIAIAVLIAIGGLYVVYRVDLLDTLLVQRIAQLGMESGGRTEAATEALSGVVDHPLGGKRTYLQLGAAHNLWGDVAYATGIVPLVFLIAFNLQNLFLTIRLLLNPSIDLLWKCLVAGSLVVLFLAFSVEPAMEGLTHGVAVYCLICGLVKRMDIELRIERRQIQSGAWPQSSLVCCTPGGQPSLRPGMSPRMGNR